MTHQFIFSTSTWLGQGTLEYTEAEKLNFNTRWEISEISPQVFQAKHKVEIQGADESHFNIYTFTPIDPSKFKVIIQNPIVHFAEGIGFIEEDKIGWRIKTSDIEGYEIFVKIDEKTYTLSGEYFSQEVSSKIEGKIWKKHQP